MRLPCLSLTKSSYFDRYARSQRPIRTFTSVDTSAHIDRCETTLSRFLYDLNIMIQKKKRSRLHLIYCVQATSLLCM